MKSSNEEPPPKRKKTSPSTPPRTTEPLSPTTPSTQVAEATSAGSRADYTCYTIRDCDNGIFAVVIETKMDKSSQDALNIHLPEHLTLQYGYKKKTFPILFRSVSLSFHSSNTVHLLVGVRYRA